MQNDILENGYRSVKTKTSIQVLDESIKTLTERNPETLFIVVGDHGSVKTSWIDIRKYPDFIDTLVEPRFSISPRFASFRVKEGKKKNSKNVLGLIFQNTLSFIIKNKSIEKTYLDMVAIMNYSMNL